MTRTTSAFTIGTTTSLAKNIRSSKVSSFQVVSLPFGATSTSKITVTSFSNSPTMLKADVDEVTEADTSAAITEGSAQSDIDDLSRVAYVVNLSYGMSQEN